MQQMVNLGNKTCRTLQEMSEEHPLPLVDVFRKSVEAVGVIIKKLYFNPSALLAYQCVSYVCIHVCMCRSVLSGLV